MRNYRISEWHDRLARTGFGSRLLERFGVRLDFEDWVQRMRTPPDRVAQLRRHLDAAKPSARKAFALGPRGRHDWTIPVALLRAS